MRNTLCLWLMVMIGITSCTEQKTAYTITGTINGIDTAMVFLKKRELSQWITIDSTVLQNHNFTFTGSVTSPEMYYIIVTEKDILLPFFIDNADIDMVITADSALVTKVSGSAPQDIYQMFLRQNDKLDKEKSEIYKAYRKAEEAGDEAGIARADSLYEDAEVRQKEMILQFAKDQGTSVVAPYLILRYAYLFELPEMEEVMVALDTSLNGMLYYDDLMKRVAILRAVQVGQPAPELIQTDTAGQPFALSSLKGRVVLVDFWASWCGPCRAENPNVVKAWKSFHDKGFDVLGVSLDKNRDKWLAAVKDDGLTWYQVSDLQGWNNAASGLYGVSSIPANVLVDREGIIVARNLRGDDLLGKLKEVMDSDGK